jgi:opacity protein-like surface antigen
MKRFALAALAVATLSAPAMAADCAKDYKAFWDNLDRGRFAKMSPEQFADLSRTTLRGYDACTAGDQRFTAESLAPSQTNFSDCFFFKKTRISAQTHRAVDDRFVFFTRWLLHHIRVAFFPG